MRKLILIAAVSFAAMSGAQAGQSRGLSLASAEPAQAITQQPAVQSATAPKTAETVPAPAAQQPTPPASSADRTEASRPRAKRVSTEARIIRELHRHGIYW